MFCLKQGSHIRIYNVDKGWKVQKDILAKSLRWTITDTCLSPDQRYLVSLWWLLVRQRGMSDIALRWKVSIITWCINAGSLILLKSCFLFGEPFLYNFFFLSNQLNISQFSLGSICLFPGLLCCMFSLLRKCLCCWITSLTNYLFIDMLVYTSLPACISTFCCLGSPLHACAHVNSAGHIFLFVVSLSTSFLCCLGALLW